MVRPGLISSGAGWQNQPRATRNDMLTRSVGPDVRSTLLNKVLNLGMCNIHYSTPSWGSDIGFLPGKKSTLSNASSTPASWRKPAQNRIFRHSLHVVSPCILDHRGVNQLGLDYWKALRIGAAAIRHLVMHSGGLDTGFLAHQDR